MSALPKNFKEIYARTRNDIFAFASLFGYRPTHQHRELLQAVQDGHKRIAVKSGQGPGKTAAAVIVGLWKAWRHVDTRIVVTAPTMRQCKDVWLSECRKWVGRAHPTVQKIIKVMRSKVEIAGRPDWGVKLLTATSTEAAQGQHEDHLVFIADEASGIEHEFWQQIYGTLTNEDSLFLAIGNPNTRSCAFFDCFNALSEDWHTITFNAEESPDWLVSKDQHRLLEKLYGRESDVYRVRVLGEFPTEDPNTIIPLHDCQACMEKGRMRKFSVGSEKVVAIDLARYGSDESVIVLRQGMSLVDMKVLQKREPTDVVHIAAEMAESWGWDRRGCIYVPDATGMGQGVMGMFYEKGLPVYEFHNGSRAMRSRQFENKITEAWFNLAALIRGREVSLSDDPRLLQQLTTRQYFIKGKNGKIVVETKDEYAKRGFDSPDRADAVVMAYYNGITETGGASQRVHSGEYVGTKWQS